MSTQVRHPEGTPVGGQFASTQRPAATVSLAAVDAMPTDADIHHLQAMAGVFEDGYDDRMIDTELAKIEGAHLVCLWAEKEEGEYSGDSEIIGRDAEGTWRRIHADLWEHLLEPSSSLDVTSVPLLGEALTDQDYDRRLRRRNVAEIDMDACTECGESNLRGDGFDGLCGDCADRAETEGRWGD